MAKRIKIELVSNPTPTVTLVFVYAYGIYSNAVGATIGGAGVTIGGTKEITTTNLYNYYNGLTLPTFVDVAFSKSGNIIYVDITGDNDSLLNITYISSSQSSILINEVVPPAIEPLKNIFTRSTYSLRTTPTETFDSLELNLSILNGDINDNNVIGQYNLSKQVIQLGQLSSSFDINNLINGFIEISIDNYTSSGIINSPYNLSCWATYSVTAYSSGLNVYEWSGSFFCLYGYGYFEDGYNPTYKSNVLITGNKHTYFESQDSRVFFITKDLTSLTVNGVTQTITANEDVNNEYLQSLNLKDYTPSSNKITLIFNYPDETRTIVYDVNCEVKYDVVNCIFINRYGVPQSFFFNKVKKESISVDSKNYRGLLADNGVFNTSSHLYRDFNKNGKQKIVLNTDNIDEAQNQIILEIMLSEKVWLIDNGIIKPVVLKKDSLEYKTSINDKQIQYTLEFEEAFDKINQVY